MLFTNSVLSTSGIVFPNTDLSAGEYHIFINNLYIIFFNKKVSFEENINSTGFPLFNKFPQTLDIIGHWNKRSHPYPFKEWVILSALSSRWDLLPWVGTYRSLYL